ncbi:hypothetical protein EVAR_36290_1 [Eumeta japonica]|uniref:Uncharacterized protein n=1 Tax=Eumeta variegata TaxID=151549 RepID=A0A4C1VGU5_EUMVA|nr:hypothetical protein EVAR_36290_1 [Eumeta japonica]
MSMVRHALGQFYFTETAHFFPGRAAPRRARVSSGRARCRRDVRRGGSARVSGGARGGGPAPPPSSGSTSDGTGFLQPPVKRIAEAVSKRVLRETRFRDARQIMIIVDFFDG